MREKVSHYRRDCTYNVVGGECEDFHKNVVDDRKVKRRKSIRALNAFEKKTVPQVIWRHRKAVAEGAAATLRALRISEPPKTAEERRTTAKETTSSPNEEAS